LIHIIIVTIFVQLFIEIARTLQKTDIPIWDVSWTESTLRFQLQKSRCIPRARS